MVATPTNRRHRKGGLYVAVLGTSLIVALLGLAALTAQRIQNRFTSNGADIRQAQLNARTAVELALLTMKTDASWRTSQTNGRWFTGRSTGNGTCSADVTDLVDNSLSNNADDPVLVRGIGYSGAAEQRMEVTIDPRKEPLSALRSAIAAGSTATISNAILRTGGLITANQINPTSGQVYGTVQATSVSGSTYNGTTTQIIPEKLPTMPDWTSVFNYYRTNGTPLDATLLPQQTPNLGTNTGIELGTTGWTGTPPYATLGTCSVSQSNNFKNSGTYSLRVQSRQNWYSGPVQRIDNYVKPGSSYYVEMYVYINNGLPRNFWLSLYTKGTSNASPSFDTGPSTFVLLGALNLGWTKVSATLTAPAWSGNLEYAFVKIAGADSNNTGDFYVDDLTIRENVTGRFIYQKVLGPGVDTIYPAAPINAQGLYWINCNNERLIIERSRIVGTLLVVNPGAGSYVAGPVNWSPATAGYPALLVDADTASNANFTFTMINRILSENENGINYNPPGAPHDEFGTNATFTDIYRSSIRGLVAVRNNVTYSNRSLIRGQLLVGGSITSSGGELEVEWLPDALLNPPPNFWSYSYPKRASSYRKAVLP